MIILNQKLGEVSGSNQYIVIKALVDSPSDLPALNVLDPYILAAPSEITCINDSSRWILNEAGVWKQQVSDTQVSIDLSGYYTAAQTDNLFYTKTYIDTTLDNYYTKTYIDINYYEKVEIDGRIEDLTTLANGKMPLKFADYTTIPDGANIGYGTTAGNYTTPGVYVRTTSSAGIAGRPSDYQAAFLLIVRNTSAESRYQQELYPLANVSGSVQHFFYKRYYTAAGWQDWSKFEGTATAPYVPNP